MDRRDFLKKGSTAAAIAAIGFPMLKSTDAKAASSVLPNAGGDLVAVMGDSPKAMVRKAIEELGGMNKYIKAGQSIVVKPNIGWAKGPEMAVNTNPEVVGELVKMCIEAGAKEVLVFDHTCHEWNSCYDKSGTKVETEANGGKMVPGNNEKYYKEVELPLGKKLSKTKIHEAIINCDAWINVPVLKQHGGAKMSLAMKNSMGIIWDRKSFHMKGLQQCIADLATYEKKAVLNVVDGYKMLTQNGPQGKGVEDTVDSKVLFASTDPVAVDAASVKFFNQVKEMPMEEVSHIEKADALNVGTMDLTKMNVKRIKL